MNGMKYDTQVKDIGYMIPLNLSAYMCLLLELKKCLMMMSFILINGYQNMNKLILIENKKHRKLVTICAVMVCNKIRLKTKF